MNPEFQERSATAPARSEPVYGKTALLTMTDVRNCWDAPDGRLEVLRLEKGYILIGSDTNGRTTPDDDWIVTSDAVVSTPAGRMTGEMDTDTDDRDCGQWRIEGDRFVLRSITDEIMHEISKLSGQEYVDVYASSVKNRSKSAVRR